MAYKNIIYVKLFLSLFDEDDRFLYRLTEKQQLLFLKMLYLAGRQENKIAKNPLAIIQKVAYQGTTQELLNDLSAIKSIFRKFTETKYYYTFTNFDELHNWVKLGNSQKGKKESQDKDKDKDKEEEEDKDKELATPKVESQVLENPIFNNQAFKNAFDDFLAMRQKLRKPATERAKEIILAKLEKYPIEIAIAMLEQSIVNSWQDVYPLKDQEIKLTKQQKSNLQGLKNLMQEIKDDERSISAGVCSPDGSVSGITVQQ